METIADDILEGAEEIAAFIFGTKNLKKGARRVYELAARGELPVFKFGQILHGRKSTLADYIATKEKASLRQVEEA